MTLPKYVENLLTSKKSRQCCADHREFCIPVIRSFRFLVQQKGFRIKECARARRETWVTLRGAVPDGLKTPKLFSAVIDIYLEIEAGSDFVHGTLNLRADSTGFPTLRSHTFWRLLKDHGSQLKAADFRRLEFGQQIARYANFLESHWDDVILRLTRKIRLKK